MAMMSLVRGNHVAVARSAYVAGTLLLLASVTAHTQNLDHLSLTQIANGLVQPIGFVAPGDGSQRMFIIEQPGVIRIYNMATGTVNSTPFLNISIS